MFHCTEKFYSIQNNDWVIFLIENKNFIYTNKIITIWKFQQKNKNLKIYSTYSVNNNVCKMTFITCINKKNHKINDISPYTLSQ